MEVEVEVEVVQNVEKYAFDVFVRAYKVKHSSCEQIQCVSAHHSLTHSLSPDYIILRIQFVLRVFVCELTCNMYASIYRTQNSRFIDFRSICVRIRW